MKSPASTQFVGLTAALAAAAGAVGFSHGAVAPDDAGNAATPVTATQDVLTTARIDRRQLASRDASRVDLSQVTARRLQANAIAQAKARTAKLDAARAQSQRRAAALVAAKVAAQRAKAAAEAKEVAAEKAAAAKEAAAERAAEAEAAEEKQTSGAKLPVAGYRITATFGQGGGRWARNHTGTDFAAPIGTTVRAVKSGVVVGTSYAGAYGNQARIRHDDGTETWYCHLSGFSVSAGESVGAGDQVGSVGMTGNTTGPHLHLEVRPGGGEPINPMGWLQDLGLNP